MIFRRKKTYPYPKVKYPVHSPLYFDREYYVVKSEAVSEMVGEFVCFKGKVSGKVIVHALKAGLPWSIESRLIEKDHYHKSVFKVDGVEVIFLGVIYVRNGEEVTVYGKVEKDGSVTAEAIDTENALYLKGGF